MTERLSAFSYAAARTAAQNWRRNKKKRQHKVKALRDGQFTKAETREHLAQRANHLATQIKAVTPASAMSGELAEMVRRPFTADDMSDVLFERVLGVTTDFLSVDFIARASQAIRSVGRIVVDPPNARGSLGTGFMITERLLMTNHHVLETNRVAKHSTVEFDFQRGADGRLLPVQRFNLDPATFFHADERLDYAVVAVEPVNAGGVSVNDYKFLELNPRLGKITLNEPLNIVQHPLGEMKQVVLRENRLLDLPETPDFVAHYEGDTEPGSSGAPVFNDAWEVVALHHSGVPATNDEGQILDKDGDVWERGDDPENIEWVANEGIRVSRLARDLHNALNGTARGDMLRSLFSKLDSENDGENAPRDRDRPVSNFRSMTPAPRNTISHTHAAAGAPEAVSVTIPLNITVSLGAASANVPSPLVQNDHLDDIDGAGASDIPLAEDTPSRAELDTRDGYDPNFLEFPAPLPALNPSMMENARVRRDDDEIELRYTHFTTVMNEARKLAYFSAGNMDRQARFQHKREDGFRSDPRVRRGVQATNRFYSNNPLDRGHLWRRDAGAWGNTRQEARNGNDDSYFWTNIAPQHFIFNQSGEASSRDLLLWGNLENEIAGEAESENQRVSVFCGPVFSRLDPFHRNLKIPKRYWKIVIYENDDGDPAAAGFILSQSSLIRTLPRERLEEFDFSDFSLFQEPIAKIARLTELDFGELVDFDVLVDGSEDLDDDEAVARIERRIRGIEDLVV